MNVIALVFLIVSATVVMVLRRERAPIPLLASCCYMTIGQGVELGPISLPVYRLVLAAGLLRVLVRRETMAGGINMIDKLMIAWAAWMVFASFFHEWRPGSGPVYASGFVYNIMLVYFLTRVWCRDLSELMAVLRMVAWLLVPVAVAMLAEHILERNFFGMLFGGVPEGVYVRDGKIRAQGPFVHPLLAGTVGAVCFPLLIGIWRRYRVSATIGLAACIAMVFASTSSGPLMSLFMGMFALLMWFYRGWLRVVRWAVIGAYVSAEILMTQPAYFLISKIDLTGSSTGWHRSKLIQVAFEHLSEWWVFGTDYTAHWGINTIEGDRHVDVTNYYLWIGTIGGLPAMLLLIAIMWCAFVWVGKSVRNAPAALQEHRFMIWCLGAGLFAHAAMSLSMGYTDQSMMFFWLNIGIISSMYSVVVMAVAAEKPACGAVNHLAKRPFAAVGRPLQPLARPGARMLAVTSTHARDLIR
jgi:hypothetical protein